MPVESPTWAVESPLQLPNYGPDSECHSLVRIENFLFISSTWGIKRPSTGFKMQNPIFPFHQFHQLLGSWELTPREIWSFQIVLKLKNWVAEPGVPSMESFKAFIRNRCPWLDTGYRPANGCTTSSLRIITPSFNVVLGLWTWQSSGCYPNSSSSFSSCSEELWWSPSSTAKCILTLYKYGSSFPATKSEFFEYQSS